MRVAGKPGHCPPAVPVPDLGRGRDRGRRLGLARFERAAPRDQQAGRQKPSLRILRALFTALDDPAGVIAHRRGALERVQLLLADWRDTQRKLADTEQRMTGVLDELELTELVTSIPAPSVAEADVRGE